MAPKQHIRNLVGTLDGSSKAYALDVAIKSSQAFANDLQPPLLAIIAQLAAFERKKRAVHDGRAKEELDNEETKVPQSYLIARKRASALQGATQADGANDDDGDTSPRVKAWKEMKREQRRT